MEFFQVGGSVRDSLMGRPSEDLDYVVVGATPSDMKALGYTQVGADFPVFLHPETRDEYALARTERKAGQGYHGFTVSTEGVTLEEDLSRRDLTINAMAFDAEGLLVDPFEGEEDLRQKTFRHVSDAFAEDPVRVLRVLRFQARFGAEWRIADETKVLMHQMVQAGTLDHVTPERIWKEVSRGLMEKNPELMVNGLLDFGLYNRKGFAAYRQAQRDNATLQQSAREGASLEARFALAFATQDVPSMGNEIPKAVKLLAKKFSAFVTAAQQGPTHRTPESTMTLLEEGGNFKQGDSFSRLVEALSFQDAEFSRFLASRAQRLAALDTRVITQEVPPGPAVSRAIRNARLNALALI
jgi:tRNA nucleotidyltransferase (CCA-adding enzyme)